MPSRRTSRSPSRSASRCCSPSFSPSSTDATLPLAARTARANAEGADLFVSIHANASPRPRLHGVETYYLNNTHERGTIRLAAMENGLSLPTPARGGADLRYIVSDLVQAAKMEESIALATAV